MKKTILIINGPNLNLLGKREPEIYGNQTLEAVMGGLVTLFPDINFEFVQSNHEGVIVDRLNACVEKAPDGIIINGGAFTHYSYSIYDALKMLNLPKVEVHISHIFNREEFRKTSVIAPACDTMISGAGVLGYELAVRAILKNE
ncbi:MAG: type II 3-dehydroquinate dehydratase [Bacteroidia bacterium]